MRRVGYWHPSVVVGEPPQDRNFDGVEQPCQVHPSATLEAFVSVDRGTRRATVIGPNAWVMKGTHVGHDAQIGARTELAPLCSVGGHVEIGDDVRVGQGAVFKPFVKVGDGARIGACSFVNRDVPAGEVWAGVPARRLR